MVRLTTPAPIWGASHQTQMKSGALRTADRRAPSHQRLSNLRQRLAFFFPIGPDTMNQGGSQRWSGQADPRVRTVTPPSRRFLRSRLFHRRSPPSLGCSRSSDALRKRVMELVRSRVVFVDTYRSAPPDSLKRPNSTTVVAAPPSLRRSAWDSRRSCARKEAPCRRTSPGCRPEQYRSLPMTQEGSCCTGATWS
jgi:hypothetical protein